MKEETYLRAKVIMDEVERLRCLKSFKYPAECYSIYFDSSSSREIAANASDIGVNGMEKLINTYTDIIDDLITEKLQRLEELE